MFKTIYWLIALLVALLSGGCVTTGAPRLKNLDQLTEIYDLKYSNTTTSTTNKKIYVGVYGGNLPPESEAEGFDPQHWPPYQQVNPFSDNELSQIAFQESVLNVIGLRIAKQFPDSVTLVIRGDGDVVAETVERFYFTGDRVYLAGFSFGGNAVVEAAQALKQKGIPVAMTAQIDSIGFRDVIPSNVARAFNFHSVGDFFCPGKNKIVAEDPCVTLVTNQSIPDPKGPFTWGTCTVHRNMDSDPRVWKTIVDYILQSDTDTSQPMADADK